MSGKTSSTFENKSSCMYLLLTNMVELELGCRFSSNPCLAKPGSRLSFRVNEQLVGVSLHRHKMVEMHVTLTQSGLMVSLGRCHEHPHSSVYMQRRCRGSPTYSLLAQKLQLPSRFGQTQAHHHESMGGGGILSTHLQ